MSKRLGLIVVVILALFLGTEIFLPKFLENAVAQGMTTLTGSKEVSVTLEKSPAVLMLAGKFDRVTLDAAQARIDKIVVSSMHVVLENIEFDPRTLLNGQKAVVKNVGNVELAALITQEELAGYLNTSVKGLKGATVEIQPEKIDIASSLTIGGLARLDVKIQGKIAADSQKIKFIPEKFFINDSQVSNNSLIAGMSFAEITLIDSSRFPFGVIFRNAVSQNGQITITADNISH